MVFHIICISLPYSENRIRDTSAGAGIYRGLEIHDTVPYHNYFVNRSEHSGSLTGDVREFEETEITTTRMRDWISSQVQGIRPLRLRYDHINAVRH
jgi:hypothetical protein